MVDLQRQYIQTRFIEELKPEEERIQIQLEERETQEETLWKQISWNEWLKAMLPDDNTNCFFTTSHTFLKVSGLACSQK